MGWWNPDLDPNNEHEGYIVALVPATNPDGTASDWRYRELSGEASDHPGPHDRPLHTVQVGCPCGWRSPRLDAPSGSVWVPFAVFAPEWFEDRCRELWKEHVVLEAKRRCPRYPVPCGDPQCANWNDGLAPAARAAARAVATKG